VASVTRALSAPAGTMAGLMKNRAAIIWLAVAVVASAALLFSFGSQLTFIADSWELLLERREWAPASFFEPFNEHPVVAPTLVFKVLVEVFGMSSALPFFAVATFLFLLSAVLLFAYLQSRVGAWPALFAAVLVLFLGAASEDLLWEFQMGFFGSVAAGLGMLIALDRESRRGDLAACALLVVAIAFSSIGVVFAAAALVDLALGRRPRARRAYVAALPLALYALWWLGWGQDAGGNVTWENLERLPRYVFDAAAAGLASLLGRDPLADGGHAPGVFQLLLVLLAGLAAVRVGRERSVSKGLAIALTLAVAFWVLGGLDRNADRYPTSSRYQYPSAVFLLLIAGELLRGIRLSRLATIAMAGITAIAVLGGVSLLQRDFDNTWRPSANDVRLQITAVGIAGEKTRPDLVLTFPTSVPIPARIYLAARADHGAPEYGEAELLSRSEEDRQRADAVLAYALGLRLRPSGRNRLARGCRTLPRFPSPSDAELIAGTFSLRPVGQASFAVRLRRFADRAAVDLGRVLAGETAVLSIPADGSARPWHLATGHKPLRLCRLSVASA
jgi:hypothetical protein